MATAPLKTTTLRCRWIRPATTAPRPNRAAKLNTLEPRTTPAPTVAWWCSNAVIEAVISGASAANAASMPSSASESPRLSPTGSSRDTNTQLVPKLTTAPTAKARTESPTFMSAQVSSRRRRSGGVWRDTQPG